MEISKKPWKSGQKGDTDWHLYNDSGDILYWLRIRINGNHYCEIVFNQNEKQFQEDIEKAKEKIYHEAGLSFQSCIDKISESVDKSAKEMSRHLSIRISELRSKMFNQIQILKCN